LFVGVFSYNNKRQVMEFFLFVTCDNHKNHNDSPRWNRATCRCCISGDLVSFISRPRFWHTVTFSWDRAIHEFENKRQRSRRKWLRFPLRRSPICTYREDEVDKSLDIRRFGGRITSITLWWKRVRSWILLSEFLVKKR